MDKNFSEKPGSILNGRYQLKKLLGRGGMSKVFLAVDLKEGREVAVKEDPGKEAEILLRLNHESIVWALDSFYSHGRKYLVEEYLDLPDLESTVRKDGPFSVEEAFRIGLELCSVLTYLHEQKPPVIYRDLKPQNVLLRADGRIVLIDFGIAREYVSGEEKDTTSYGTVGYAAPEQFEGSRTQSDGRADLFALGKVLCFLITGLKPGKQGSELKAIIPDQKAAQILQTCIEEDPEDRFQNAEILSFALSDWLESEQERSRNPEKEKKVLRKNPGKKEGGLRKENYKKRRPDNPAAIALTFLSVLILLAGFAYGLGKGYQDFSMTGSFSWLSAGLIWFGSFAGGLLSFGLSQTLWLLQEIKDRLERKK